MNGTIRRPSAALVISVIALCVAIGGAGVFALAAGSNNGKIVAYALVKPNGHVVGNKSLNISASDVDLESTSAYCFRHLPTFKGISVTADYFETASPSVSASTTSQDCSSSNTDAEVATSDGSGFAPQGFYVEFYK
jgi:hypothetical protein